LQINPRQDLHALVSSQEQTLHSYGWVNRDAGVAHIPIDEAMRLTVERGLPVRAPENRGTK
jgi:hypothetical protein